jgi:hypothetical protein
MPPKYATRWLAELPHVIWGLWTQVSSATSYSPFFLVYGSEAVLLTDLAVGALGPERPRTGGWSLLAVMSD